MAIDFDKIRKGVSKEMARYRKAAGDFDKDGVKNFKDCQPFNRKKQDVEPNIYIEEKLRRLPIFLTDKRIPPDKEIEYVGRIIKGNYYFHLLSRQARERTPRLRKEVLSMFKRNPDLMGVIRRKRPKYVLFTSKYPGEGAHAAAFAIRNYGGVIVVYPHSLQNADLFRSVELKEDYRKTEAVMKGSLLRHEAEHISQLREERRAGRRGGERTPRYFKGEYEDQPGEREAFKEQQRFIRERSREKEQSLGKRALSGLKRIFG